MIVISLGSVALFLWAVFLVAAVGLVVGGLWTRRRDRWFRLAVDYRGFLILAVAALGLMFGFVGELIKHNDFSTDFLPSVGAISDRLYAAVQELLLNGSIEPDAANPLFSQAARAAGVALLILLAYEAINKVFADPILTFQLRRQKGHTVVFGLGRIGFHLVQDLLNQGKRLTVVELDPDNSYLPQIEVTSALLVVGNATDEAQLTRVNVTQAAEVFVVTGDDEINLEITTYILKKLAGAPASQTEFPKMYLNLRNLRLTEVCSQAVQRHFPDGNANPTGRRPVVRPFNSLDRSLQRLFDDDVLRRRPKHRHEVAHFVIVGFGEAGQEVALHLAESAHFENLKRSRMTIVYAGHEQAEVEKFTRLYPQFFPAQVADPWNLDPKLDDWSYGVHITYPLDGDPPQEVDIKGAKGVTFAVNGGFSQMAGGVNESEFVENIVAICKEPGTKPMIFLCDSQDDQSCVDAVELRHELDRALKSHEDYYDQDWRVTIFPFLPQRPTLFEVYESRNHSQQDLIPWGDCRSSCSHARLTSELWYQLASEIRRDYTNSFGVDATKPFEKLELWERYSNAQAAKHFNAKLAVIGTNGLQVGPPGIETMPLSGEDEFTLRDLLAAAKSNEFEQTSESYELLELIARIEHNRWMAERLLSDWRFGIQNAHGRPENKRRISMVPWEQLLSGERTKDFGQVRRILKFCVERLEPAYDSKSTPRLTLGRRKS